MRRKFDKTETMMEKSNWRTGVNRAETNQHKEMEMSAEMSEIISLALTVLAPGPCCA